MSGRRVAGVIGVLVLVGAITGVWWLADQEQAVAVPARYTGAAAANYRHYSTICSRAPRPGGKVVISTGERTWFIEFGGRRYTMGVRGDARSAGCIAALKGQRGWGFVDTPPPSPPTCSAGLRPVVAIAATAGGSGTWIWKCVAGSS